MWKRIFTGVLIVILVGISSYVIILNIFTGLKVSGYDYLFTAKEPYDLVIKHATVLNGAGADDPLRADIAIRKGLIVGLGYINPKESPVFDAGGLMIIPSPLKVTAGEQTVEHLLSTAYPRYNADEIFLQSQPYDGISLAEAAFAAGLSADKMFDRIRENSESGDKVLIAVLEENSTCDSAKEYLARLTGCRADFLGLDEKGIIKDGKLADFYIFKTKDFPEEKLLELFKQGAFPEPIYIVQNGEFIKQ